MTIEEQAASRRWRAVFHETGGYDCMTGAWRIVDDKNKVIATVDQRDYGQEYCDWEFRSQEAEDNAKLIAALRSGK